MTFAHPAMLAGIGAAALPLVIHLLARVRPKPVRWGGMMFLKPDAVAGERPAWTSGWIRLFLRMLIIALLAAALARPVIGNADAAAGMGVTAEGGQTAAEESPICAIVLFDNSASMAFDEGTAGRRIETARTTALSLLNHMKPADEVHVIPLASPLASSGEFTEADAPTDLQSAVAEIADMQLAAGPSDIAAGLGVAARLAARSTLPRKAIFVIADRQATSWRNVTDMFAATWRERTLPIHSSLRLLDIPIGSESSTNVAIDRIVPPPPPVVRKVQSPVDVIVHNFGRAPVRGISIDLRSIGQRFDERRTIDLSGGEVANVRFIVRFPNPGPHILLARIDNSAALPGDLSFDDRSQAVAEVVDPVLVQCAAPSQASQSLASQSQATRPSTTHAAATGSATEAPTSLCNALMKATGTDDGEAGAPLAITHEADITTDWADHLAGASVAAVADVRLLQKPQLEKLDAFVSAGGGLMVFPGEAGSGGVGFLSSDGLLPVSLGPAHDIPASPIVATGAARRAIPAFANNPKILAGMQVRRFCPIVERAAAATVLLQTSDGHPLCVGQKHGRGRVLMMTSALSPPWNDIAASEGADALLRSLVQFLAVGDAMHLNLATSEPLEIQTGDLAGARATVQLPDGSHQDAEAVTIGARSTVRFLNTSRPGRYALTIHSEKMNREIPFIVRPDRDESDLTPLPAARRQRLEQMLDMTRCDPQSPEEMEAAIDRPVSHPLWREILWTVFALMLIESWLARPRLAKSRLATSRRATSMRRRRPD